MGGGGGVVEVQHVAADGHGTVTAIIHEFGPGRGAGGGGVVAEGVEEVAGVVGGDAGLGEAGAQGEGGGGAFVAAGEEDVFHDAEAGDLVGGGEGWVVGDVVGVAGEGVEGVDVRAEAAGEEDADGEVFLGPVFAGRGFD
jgi:hypothetical protein